MLSDDEKAQAGSPWGPANPQALNRYAYGLNNPLRYTDPSGHGLDPTNGKETEGGYGGPGGGGGTPRRRVAGPGGWRGCGRGASGPGSS
jgi:hypothetical protein